MWSELALVVEAIKQTKQAKRKGALATVIRVTGSAYRREGAKMWIDENETVTGMISGGCLESDVAEVAKQVIESDQPIIKTYALDEDVVWGLGLGCPGTVEIYIEPMPKDEEVSVFDAWLESVLSRKEGVLVTVLDQESDNTLTRFLISNKDELKGTLTDSVLQHQMNKIAKHKLNQSNPKSELITLALSSGQEVRVFFDVCIPPTTLLIFGAGHDAVPVAQFGVSLGMRTIVVDQRPAYNSEERFPETERIIARTDQFSDLVTINRRTYVVVMNHHLEKDQETLAYVLPSDAPYIGVLGPKSRRQRMLETLQIEGFVFSPEQLNRMHSPVGLDIGAVTSEEIAISIIAEIIAVRNGHRGGFLQNSEFIHTV